MPKDRPYSTRARVIKILRAIVEQPNRYTKRELAELYNVDEDTITGDFAAFKVADFHLTKDDRHRYAFVESKPLKKMEDLLHFSKEDRFMLYEAIDRLPHNTERQQQLKAKLSSIYDFSQLGHSYLRKPYLSIVDMLKQAKDEKKQVILKNYHSSNGSTVSDRTVEAFHIVPADDMIHTFDVEKKAIRHFRISRFNRVQVLDQPWQYEGHHNIMLTDPFRIVNNDQVMVHLRLSVGAYNELKERYPLTGNYIMDTNDPNIFDFQCAVNKEFRGLSNFILGFHHLHIEVVTPQALLVHLRSEVEKLKF